MNGKTASIGKVVWIAACLVACQPSMAASPAIAIGEHVTDVVFATEDQGLQALHDAAVRGLRANVSKFAPGLDVLVEGGGYRDAWLETQPMGGEMYAKRDLRIALNNQRVFMLAQRTDGRLPGMVVSGNVVTAKGWDKNPPEGFIWFPDPGIAADFEMLQGFCFPMPAWRMNFWIGGNRDYLQNLYQVLAAFDAYLWKTRDSNQDGLLETWCLWDTGEDHANRLISRWVPTRWPFEQPPGTAGMPRADRDADYRKYWWHPLPADRELPAADQVLAPFASMDVMAYSYSARDVLSLVAAELGNGKELYWRSQANDVRKRLVAGLWDAGRSACYDKDRLGRRLPELIHNNLRCMWYGVFTQEMADAFIRCHLLNPSEFWTPVPLPSVAVNEAIYANEKGNNWSGQPQGLTYQRAIEALERYGHHAEVTMLGRKLIPVLIRNGCQFSQQLDPMTGAPSGQKPDGYGPMMLASLEYLSRLHGIHLDVVEGQVWWSSSDPSSPAFRYVQKWGERRYEMKHRDGKFQAFLNDKPLFACDAGVRVITNLEGKVIRVVGSAPASTRITLVQDGKEWTAAVAPNEVHSIGPDGLILESAVPFDGAGVR